MQRDHLLLGDEAQRLVLARCGGALVVGEDDLDLGAFEPGQALAVRERKVLQVGVAVVDEVDRELDGGLGEIAGAGGVAAERIDGPDLDCLLRAGAARKAHYDKRCGERAEPARSTYHLVSSGRLYSSGRPASRGKSARCFIEHYGMQPLPRSTFGAAKSCAAAA